MGECPNLQEVQSWRQIIQSWRQTVQCWSNLRDQSSSKSKFDYQIEDWTNPVIQNLNFHPETQIAGSMYTSSTLNVTEQSRENIHISSIEDSSRVVVQFNPNALIILLLSLHTNPLNAHSPVSVVLRSWKLMASNDLWPTDLVRRSCGWLLYENCSVKHLIWNADSNDLNLWVLRPEDPWAKYTLMSANSITWLHEACGHHDQSNLDRSAFGLLSVLLGIRPFPSKYMGFVCVTLGL